MIFPPNTFTQPEILMNPIRSLAALCLLLAATPLRAADPAPVLPPAEDLIKLTRSISMQDKTLRYFQAG